MPQADRNLLFGILAMQMEFVSRDELVEAMNRWVLDKQRPLGELLEAVGALSSDRHTLLDSLVAEHLKQHRGDATQSLQAVSAVTSLVDVMTAIDDADVQRSLHQLSKTEPEQAAETITVRAADITSPPIAGSTRAEDGVRYQIVRHHAKGGLGEVLVARDQELNRDVALKRIQEHNSDDPFCQSRFVQEAEITGGLEHPGIVPVYGLGYYGDGRPYYAMRFIRGDSLKEAIARYHGKAVQEIDATPTKDLGGEEVAATVAVSVFPEQRKIDLRNLLGRFVDVCDAIEYAHSRGVLHRDLKPGNIMLGKYGETLVVDWGLAKLFHQKDGGGEDSTEPQMQPQLSADSGQTQHGSAVGTPQYMSPEQAAGKLDDLGPATDVYSLGATLYCLLTGQAAFKGGNIQTILQQVRHGEFPPPRTVHRGTPPALEAICLKAMATQPEDRYASPRQLAEEIERWLADEPVTAYREPFTTRAARWARRHKALVVGTAVLMVAVITGLAITTVLIDAERRQTDAARQNAEDSEEKAVAALEKAQSEERRRALAQAESLLTAQPDSVPIILEQLERSRDLVRPLLEERRSDPKTTSAQQLRLKIALLDAHPEFLDDLVQALLDANPEQFEMIRAALVSQPKPLTERFWKIVNDPAETSARRFRAACALASLDAKSPRWNDVTDDVAGWLVAENPLWLDDWARTLKPVESLLRSKLVVEFENARAPAVRAVSGELLADMFRDDVAQLVKLSLSMNAAEFRKLFPRLEQHADAFREYREILKTAPQPTWPALPTGATERRLPSDIEQRIADADGIIETGFAMVVRLPLAEFESLTTTLATFHYRPTRVRPYRQGETMQVAAVWRRDGLPFRYALDQTAKQVAEIDQRYRGQQMVPVDVCGYRTVTGEDRYAVAWRFGQLPDEAVRMFVGLTEEEHIDAQSQFERQTNRHASNTLQLFRATDGEYRFSSIYKDQGSSMNWMSAWSRPETNYEATNTPSWLQRDVCLTHIDPRQPTRAPYQTDVDGMDPTVGETFAERAWAMQMRKGLLALQKGDYAEADEMIAAAQQLVAIMPVSYMYRAVALAFQDKADEARKELEAARERIQQAQSLFGAEFQRELERNQLFAEGYVESINADWDAARKHWLALAETYPHDDVARFLSGWGMSFAAGRAKAAEPKLAEEFASAAVKQLRRAMEMGNTDSNSLHLEPDLNPLRERDDFRKLLADAHVDRQYAALWHRSAANFESRELHGLSPAEHARASRDFAAQGFRPVAVSVSVSPFDAVDGVGDGRVPIVASVWERPLVSASRQAKSAARRAIAAIAGIRLGKEQEVRDVLRAEGLPHEMFTEMLIRAADFGIPLDSVLPFLEDADRTLRQFAALSLGKYAPLTKADERREQVVGRLLAVLRDDKDSGVHSAAEHALRSWGAGEELTTANQAMTSKQPEDGKRWYRNAQGHLMAVFEPATYLRGAGVSDFNKPGELQQSVRIPRRFAMATYETTVEQFLKFRPNFDYVKSSSPDANGPIINVSWYEAAKYCRWLSEQEGIPEDQMVYPPHKDIHVSMTLPADYLDRTGYRLPTESEWEYCARGGSRGRWCWGENPERIRLYAYSKENTYRAHAVGAFWPNRFGLFDVHGNVGEWCHDPFIAYQKPAGNRPWLDYPMRTPGGNRVVRGGAYSSDVWNVRNSTRISLVAQNRYDDVGFRVVRTLKTEQEKRE